MAKFIINKATTDTSGNTIPSGAIIGFDTNFKFGTLRVSYPLLVYRSQADYDAGKNLVYLTELQGIGNIATKQMSQAEYDALNTETGVLLTVAGWLKTALVDTDNFEDADLTLQP